MTWIELFQSGAPIQEEPHHPPPPPAPALLFQFLETLDLAKPELFYEQLFVKSAGTGTFW